MAIGNPVLLSSSKDLIAGGMRPISFYRQDQASFNEELLQQIVDQSPEVLPIRDFYRNATSVCSLGREIPLDLGERRGFIDNLLVTNDGHLVLVETKLYRNPEAIREAVVQTLEYGMAVHKMSLLDLESRIRRGGRLEHEETIRSRASAMDGVTDDFEIALERYQRTGEILLLVVADGIRTSVERITHWINEHGSSTPIQFGLVELRFFELPDGKQIVVPKTLLKTKEISRHVVVVEVQNATMANVSYVVEDEFKTSSGNSSTKTRPEKRTAPLLTRETLLASVAAGNRPLAEELLDQIESIGLDPSTKSGSFLRYGITLQGEFLPLFYLSQNGVNAYFPKRMTELLGDEAIVEYRSKLKEIAQFWNDEQMKDPTSGGLMVKYEQIKGKVKDIIDVLEEFKVRTNHALINETEAS